MEIFWDMIEESQNKERELFERAKQKHIQAFGDVAMWTRLEVDRDFFYQCVEQNKLARVERTVEWQLILYNMVMDRSYFLRAREREAEQKIANQNH